MKLIIIFITFSLLSLQTGADTLDAFSSDGCSYFPDGNIEQQDLWLACCQQHDFAYWKGGTYQQRLDSDRALKVCVANVGEPIIASLMLAGVRVGGSPILPTSFRWGYGWSYPRWYGELSISEQRQVKNLTQQLNRKSNPWLLFTPQ